MFGAWESLALHCDPVTRLYVKSTSTATTYAWTPDKEVQSKIGCMSGGCTEQPLGNIRQLTHLVTGCLRLYHAPCPVLRSRALFPHA